MRRPTIYRQFCLLIALGVIGFAFSDRALGEPVWREADFDPKNPVSALAHDGSVLLVASDKPGRGIAIWDLRKLEKTGVLKDGAPTYRALAICPDEKYCVSIGNEVVLWDLGKRVAAARASFAGNSKYAISFLSSKECVVSTHDDGTLRQLTVPDLKIAKSTSGFPDSPLITKVSPSGRILLGCGEKPRVQVWDMERLKLQEELFGHEEQILDIAFSKKEKLFASIGNEGELRIYQYFEGTSAHAFKRLHRFTIEGKPISLAWCPKAATLFVSTRKKRIEIWDAERGVQRDGFALPDSVGTAVRLFCIPDGSMLVALCSDRQLCYVSLDR